MSSDRLIRIREMARKEMRQLFRDPRTKRIVFIAPIVQLLVFGYAVNTDVRHAPVFVVDLDRSASSRRLVDALTAGGYFAIAGRSDRSADLPRALDRGAAVVGIEIPAGFARDLRAGSARIQAILDGSNSNTATIAQGYIATIAQRFAAAEAAESPTVVFASGGAGGGGPPVAAGGAIDVRARAWFNPALSSRVYNVPAVIGTLVMLMSLLLTSLGVVREREIGTLEQLLVSPLTPGELMLGKTIPVMVVAFIDLALITTQALLRFRIPLRGSVLALLLAAFLFILAGLAIGLLISTVSRTQQEAFMTLFLLFFPVIVLSGLLLPIETMPPAFRMFTLLNPLRHFLDHERGIFVKGIGPSIHWPQSLALAGIATVTKGIAAQRYRRSH
jgi:ABC-2 type transport system permease protein